MKILVTGAFGYIGNEVMKRLTKTDHSIVANDKSPQAAERFFPIWNHKSQYIHCDICDLECPNDIDLVIHLAAEVGYISCDQKPELALRTNIEGTRNVASYGKPVLFFSTGSVYGDLSEICHESSICSPQTLYSRTKLEGEQIIKHVPHCIVRPATAYGLSYSTRHNLLLHTLAQDACTGKVKVFEPDAIRTLYHVSKIADFVCYCVDKWQQFEGLTINLGCDNGTISKRHIVEKMSKHKKFEIEFVDGKDPDCRNYQVDYSKLKSVWPHSEDDLDSHIPSILEYYGNL